jgi:monooxygenase
VVLLERSAAFSRQYRGEILQPGASALLDRLGVLAQARRMGAHEHDRFQFVDRGRILVDADYRRLPGPYNHLLSIPQRHLLDALQARAQRYDTFTLLEPAKVTRLLLHDGAVRGVVAEGPGGPWTVRARVVLGADGRYSKVRALAGIGYRRTEVFDSDVLWFKVPATGPEERVVRIFRANGNPMIAYSSVPHMVQLGWTLRHGSYKELAAHGLDHLKALLRAAAPPYAEQVDATVTRFKDLSLLDVFAGVADEWVRDGLVLLGDAAHVQSPIGAQGINLAVQDAVALHPVLIRALRAGDVSAPRLRPFEALRRPAIARTSRIQVVQSKAMLTTTGMAARVRPAAAAVMSRTPAFRKVLDSLAFGDRSVKVREDMFAARPPTHESARMGDGNR